MTLVNLGDLAKPATVLVERISDAIGGIARPWQIARVAKAEGKAEVARANTRIEVSELEERALQRMVREEGIRQENMEAITNAAIPQLSISARPEDVDTDWFVHFFDKGRLVSNEDMRVYWSKMLAGEANAPGSFSRRIVDLLAGMDREDIALFSKLANNVWIIEKPQPVILKMPTTGNDTYLSFNNLKHLESLGLVHVGDPIRRFAVAEMKDGDNPQYGTERICVNPAGSEREIDVGTVLFTSAGQQMYSLCERVFNEAYYLEVVSFWADQGYEPNQAFPREIIT